ncbi:hypothetical protein PF005_g4469 [Phytophthora fragariae]|uniref:HTH CENPB-type domain-containing protein n=1 Tax=Phytophthora fragariae TaxID=53985 RepID=A0A6A3YZZ9_9STRA|nr:hypothetical protein PF011_g19984 [Phytophthora fragariae]KAE9228047.1 hypothetical protein PF005_g4469 [Phytophthora fragariae]
MAPSSKTRTCLTQQQKLCLIKKAESSPATKYEDLALWAKVEFGLRRLPGKATISRIISGRIALLRQPHENAQRKNKPSPFQLQLDQNIVEFIMLAEAEGICLSGAMIVFYATVLAKKLGLPRHRQPRFGLSWLRCLQHRYGFRWRRAYGESSSVDLTKVKEELKRIQAVVTTYLPKNKEAPALKQNKARVTMACYANADGSEKLPLLFLGTAEKPRWYKDKPSSLQYMGTSKGWMTT